MSVSGLSADWANYEEYGQIITGLKVDDHRFVAVMKFGRLERLVSDPLVATNPKIKGTSAALDEYAALQGQMQRSFDGGRKKNVDSYAEYIVDLSKGKFGDTPTIDFFSPESLHVREREAAQKSEMLWPYDLTCVPYDGETQLAARFKAARDDAKTRDQPIIVTITHGRPIAHGRQCFHDRNALQRRASASLALKMNSRDPLLNVVREIEEHVAGLSGTIEWEGRQVKPGRVATASGVRTAVACFAHGIAGVQSSKEEELPTGLSEEQFTARALAWFGKILPNLLPYMADRDKYVTSSPAVWAAIGALGHPLVDESLNQTDNKFEHIVGGLAAKLVGVRWNKGEEWVGLAVKSTAGGYSFAGGAKDSGSACFKALSDNTEASYSRIRGMGPKVA